MEDQKMELITEHQKILKLLNEASDSRFMTKNGTLSIKWKL